jgi:Flp pilus assembly pilin Flp
MSQPKEKQMNTLKNKLVRLGREESGQSLIEYSLIASIVAIGTMLAMYLMRQEIIAVFTRVTAGLAFSL